MIAIISSTGQIKTRANSEKTMSKPRFAILSSGKDHDRATPRSDEFCLTSRGDAKLPTSNSSLRHFQQRRFWPHQQKQNHWPAKQNAFTLKQLNRMQTKLRNTVRESKLCRTQNMA